MSTGALTAGALTMAMGYLAALVANTMAQQLAVYSGVVGGLDFVGFVSGAAAVEMAGSGTHQVIYASLPVWMTIISSVVLKKRYAAKQWAAVIMIFAGLMFNSLSSVLSMSKFSAMLGSTGSSAAMLRMRQMLRRMKQAAGGGGTGGVGATATTGAGGATAASAVVAGMSTGTVGLCFSVLSTMLYAVQGVLLEWMMLRPDPPGPNRVLFWSALSAVFMSVGYVVAVTAPQWEALVGAEVRARSGGDWTEPRRDLAAIAMSSLAINILYYQLVGRTGAVFLGVLQGARAVLVFALSSAFFCDADHDEQCFTAMKGVSGFAAHNDGGSAP
eukprot:g767.t1